MGVLTRLRNDILCVDAIRHDPTSATSTQDDDADNGSSVYSRRHVALPSKSLGGASKTPAGTERTTGGSYNPGRWGIRTPGERQGHRGPKPTSLC